MAAKDKTKIVVLVDKEGKGLKFSSKNKPEMYTLLAEYMQSSGNLKGTVLTEQQTGFDLLPPGEKPGPEPTSSSSHKRHRSMSAASTASDTTDKKETESSKPLPKHIRKIKH